MSREAGWKTSGYCTTSTECSVHKVGLSFQRKCDLVPLRSHGSKIPPGGETAYKTDSILSFPKGNNFAMKCGVQSSKGSGEMQLGGESGIQGRHRLTYGLATLWDS